MRRSRSAVSFLIFENIFNYEKGIVLVLWEGEKYLLSIYRTAKICTRMNVGPQVSLSSMLATYFGSARIKFLVGSERRIDFNIHIFSHGQICGWSM